MRKRASELLREAEEGSNGRHQQTNGIRMRQKTARRTTDLQQVEFLGLVTCPHMHKSCCQHIKQSLHTVLAVTGVELCTQVICTLTLCQFACM